LHRSEFSHIMESNETINFTVLSGPKNATIVRDTTYRQLGTNEAYVKVAHSGVCGTDEHYLKAGKHLTLLQRAPAHLA